MNNMKELHLPVPTVFIMMGLPGAGKTFFAEQFAKIYNLPTISLDIIRHELFNDPTYTPSEQAIIGRMSDYMANELLRAKHSFIIDGTGNNIKTQRMSLGRKARESGFKTLVVWVQVDEPTAKLRALKPQPGKKGGAARRPLPPSTFEAWKKQLTVPNGEAYVVVSGKHTFEAQHKMVLRKLAPPEATAIKEPVNIITPTPAARRMHTPVRPENRRIQIS